MNALPKIEKFIKTHSPLQWDLPIQRFVLAAIIFVVIYSILVFACIPGRINVELNRPSPATIYAPREIIDEYATELLRQDAAEAITEVFDYNPAVEDEALGAVGKYFEQVAKIRRDSDLSRSEKIKTLQSLHRLGLSASAAEALLTEKAIITDLENRLSVTLAELFEQGVKAGGEKTARKQADDEIALYPLDAGLKQVALKLAEPLIEPNMIANPEATANNREEARRAVDPVILQRNTLIVSEGELVTEKQMAQLEGLGLIRGKQVDYSGIIGLFLILLIIFVLVGVYLAKFVESVYEKPKLLLLLGLVVILTLLLAIIASYFSSYWIPAAMGVILITVMFGYRLAVMVNFVIALLVGLISGSEIGYLLIALTGGLTAIYAVSRVSQRGDLARAGIYISGANVATIMAQFLFWGSLSWEGGVLKELGYALAAGIGSGLLSSVIAIGILPYLESAFGLTTSITLLELSNPNHPLLRRLQTTAPGTYYHSMIVCNLAEAAAERVNADPLLTRVGAYYHDIGKIKRPYFFNENQLSGQNPHDKLSPNLSAMIIRLHIKDGVELARKYRLPQVIEDIIEQHHGTGLIAYFYQQAVDGSGEEQVSAGNFSYEGPLPQTKEAAIIMLADAVEAGARSLSKPVGNRVEGLIRRIIKDKLNDGQMDECDLTLKELDQIGDAFARIMEGIYHTRVEYPEKDLRAEIERSSLR